MSEATGGSSLARGFVLGLLLLAVSGGQALAHRSPSNCNANRLTLSLDQNPAGNIVSGQTVVYTVGVFNPGPGTGIGCDVTGTTVTFTCPGPDGSASGETTVVGNAGTADLLNCSIGEGNPGFPGTVSVGSLAGACVADVDCGNAQATCVNGACVFRSGASSAACSATLSAAEPDKATVTCDCTPTPGEVQATAFDEANFQCQTPGLTVTKDCALRDTNGNSAVTITVTNTGSAALANCKVTDTNLTGETCTTPPGLPAAEISVAVSPT